ncbi:MAG: hypothetical protein HHJ09_14875 [Glaciimonas sp.]|nr:hypothetical protein [Glaciimonas sp.]
MHISRRHLFCHLRLGVKSNAVCRGSMLFVGDHLARSVRGISCAPPVFR